MLHWYNIAHKLIFEISFYFGQLVLKYFNFSVNNEIFTNNEIFCTRDPSDAGDGLYSVTFIPQDYTVISLLSFLLSPPSNKPPSNLFLVFKSLIVSFTVDVSVCWPFMYEHYIHM